MTREEAIKEMREKLPWLTEDTKRLVEALIPELAESEDERIRKELVAFFKEMRDTWHEIYWHDLQVEGILAWLEKRKENTWSEEDDAKVKAMCEEGDLKPSERAWLKDLSNRVWKEQKPAEHSAKGRRGRMGTTPEHIRKKAENFLSKMEPPYDADDICSAYETGAMENANPSWSEEDEKIYNKALDVIYYKDLNDKDEVVDSLKALCDLIARKRRVIPPYARWKPSEEQMEALNALNLHGDLSYVGQQNQLISLYQDLKNLM